MDNDGNYICDPSVIDKIAIRNAERLGHEDVINYLRDLKTKRHRSVFEYLREILCCMK